MQRNAIKASNSKAKFLKCGACKLTIGVISFKIGMKPKF